MKKIKKLFLLVAFVLLASASMPMISRIAKTATAAPESNFLYLTVEEFNDQVNVGAQYYITPAKIWENNNGVITEQTQESATVKVLNPFGKEVKDSTIASDGYFEVKYPGEYNIVYSYQGYSHALSLNAEEGIYAFEFEKNSQQIIPSYININDYTGKIVLPNPSVKDENGNIIASADVKVTVLNPSMAALNNEQLVKNTDGYYEFNANEAGKWTIKYEYKSANGKVLASTTKTFIANTTYNNDYKLTLTYNSGSKPDTAITNVMKELPTVAGKNAVTNDAVDIYYYITAKKVVYNNAGAVVSEDDVTEQCIANVNEFTPNTDGDYIITYHAKNFFGTTATWEYQISGVKDSQAPEVKVVKPYTTAPAEEYVDASYFLPEKAGLKNIIIPAIWAEDNVNKSLDGLTLTRRIKKTNSNTVIYDSAENPNKALVFEHDSLSHTLDENTEVAVTLAEGVTFGAGTYTVSYIAKDAAGNETTALTFKLVLENGFADNEDPSISWSETQAMPESARVGEKVTFVSPVISDNISSRIQLWSRPEFSADR